MTTTRTTPRASSALSVPPGITVPDVEMLRSVAPDFKLYTATLENTGGVLTVESAADASGASAEQNLPLLTAIGSSTVQDLQGDTMELSALQDMTTVQQGFAIMLNHSYNLPEDVGGFLSKSPWIKVENGIGDLWMEIAILTGNPRAAKTYEHLQAGAKFGISIGCMIDDAEWRGPNGEMLNQDEIDFWDVIEGRVFLHITHVTTVEFSIVSIPANRRSWVQDAAAGMLERALRDGQVDQAKRLAPIMRAARPNDYSKLVRGISSPALQRDMQRIAPRRALSQRTALWNPVTRSFLVSSGGGERSIDRADLSALLTETERVKHLVAASSDTAGSDTTMDATTLEPDVLDDAADDVTAAKGATGKASWPLAERDHAWSGSDAHKRLLEWAGGKDDLSTSKFRSVHFWSPEGDEATNVSDYKLPFCDVIGGEVKAVPNGIIACWGGHGVEATSGISEEEKDAIKRKLSAYAARMRSEFGDEDIMPPWDREESDKGLSAASSEDGVEIPVTAEGTPDAALSATEEASTPDDASDTAQETPAAEATEEPQEQKAEAEKTVSGSGGDITVKADGSHGAYDGTHTHAHSAFGDQGDDDTHEHEHTHNGDANHDHAHGSSAEPEEAASAEPDPQETPEETPEEPPTDALLAARAEILKTYNALGASLGFSPVTLNGRPDAEKCGLVADDHEAQRVITLVSGLDTITDELMSLLDIRDVDQEGGDADGDGGEGDGEGQYALAQQRIIQRALSAVLYRAKSGREFSSENLATLQMIHDELAKMTDGAVCQKTASVEEEAEPTPEGAAADDTTDTAKAAGAHMPLQAQMLLSMNGMADALKTLITEMGVSVKWVGQYDTAKAAADALQAQVAEAQEKLVGVTAATDRLTARIERVTEVPLPRPTHMARSVRPTDPALASYADFLTAGVTTPTTAAPAALLAASASAGRPATPEALDDVTRAAEYTRALEHTQLIKRDTDGMTCRYWPAGAGVLASGQSVRPTLTPEQRAGMAFQEWTAYESGGAVFVPEPGV